MADQARRLAAPASLTPAETDAGSLPGVRVGLALSSLVAVSVALLVGPVGDSRARGTPAVPTNDLQGLLSLTGVPTPKPAPERNPPQPALRPSPRAKCGPGSDPLKGIQGRVPRSATGSPGAADGWRCNVSLLGRYPGSPGGFRTWRYVDTRGRECAYYDTSLVSPLNVVRLGLGPSPGVIVLDMSDPARPVRTATLNTLPMLAPHESLNLNPRRGLLAANMGNGTSLPGVMSIYDVSRDCRRPVHQFTGPMARFGHESGFSRDGNTYWIAGGEGIAAVDVRDPKRPKKLWEGNVFAHGLNLSDDGRRLYDADPIDGRLTTLDVSQIQARRPRPVVREVSRLTWDTVTIPQNTAPMQIKGRRYLLEFDEFAFRFTAVPPLDTVGAARIIDVSRETRPRVVSNLRLAVNQPREHKAAAGDPSPLPAPLLAYSAHYCAIPREVDPEIVACSFINSGLRVFNIEDPLRPREVAYYVSPPKSATNGLSPSDFAMSQPAFVSKRREIWYTDATSGFYALRVPKSVWPQRSPGRRAAAAPRLTGLRLSRRRFRSAQRGRAIAPRRRRLGRRVGTRVRYRLSSSALVTFRVQRARRRSGRVVGGRCVRRTPRNRRRRHCIRYRTLRGGFTHRGLTGVNRFRYAGRLRGHRLRRGRYRLLARARGPGGRSRQARRRFRIVAR